MKKLVRLTAFATVVGVAAIVAGQAIAAPAAQPARSASHAKDDKFKGNRDLQFTLANGGMSVGKINPAVPQELIDKMNELKQRIISGEVKVPTTL